MAAVLCLLLALGPAPGGGGAVPLLAWSAGRELWAPPAPPAGRLVPGPLLGALLEPALGRGPSTVLLVLHEQLSIEDFTAYGGVYGNKPDSAFPNLEGALAAAGSSLVLPAVAGAAARALPHTLAQALGAAPLRVDGASLRQLRLNASLPALLLLRLPHAAGSSLMAPREVLTSNDEVLGQVLSALQEEEVPYTAVLTALRPSRELHEAPRSPQAGGRGRALLQAAGGGEEEVPPPLRWPPTGPPRVLLWAQNFTVSRQGQRRDLTARTFGASADVDLGGSSWDPQEARLVMKYSDVFGGALTVTLVLRQAWFPVSGRRWAWLAEAEVAGGGGGGGGARAPPPRRRFSGGARPPPPPWAGAAGSWRPPAPSCCPAAPPASGGCCCGGCRCRPSTSPGGPSGGRATAPASSGGAPGWGCWWGGCCWGRWRRGGRCCWACAPWSASTTPAGPPCPCPPGTEGRPHGPPPLWG